MVSIHHHGMDKECIISDSGIATITQGNMNCSFQPEQDSEEKKWYRQTDAHSSSCNRVRERTHSIILDLSPVSFIDTVTLKTLKNVSHIPLYTPPSVVYLKFNLRKQESKLNYAGKKKIVFFFTNTLLDFSRFCKGWYHCLHRWMSRWVKIRDALLLQTNIHMLNQEVFINKQINNVH